MTEQEQCRKFQKLENVSIHRVWFSSPEKWSLKASRAKLRSDMICWPNSQTFKNSPPYLEAVVKRDYKETVRHPHPTRVYMHSWPLGNPSPLPPSSAKDCKRTFLERVKLKTSGLDETTCLWGEGTLLNIGGFRGSVHNECWDTPGLSAIHTHELQFTESWQTN